MMRLPAVLLMLIVLALIPVHVNATGVQGSTGDKNSRSPQTGEEIGRQVISGGATNSMSSSFRLRATTGQPVVGSTSSSGFRVVHGFWAGMGISGGSCCINDRGNVDQSLDDDVTLGDLTVMIDHLFISLAPLVCWEEGNLDGSLPEGPGSVTLGDLTVMIDHLFISLDPLSACP